MENTFSVIYYKFLHKVEMDNKMEATDFVLKLYFVKIINKK